MTRLFTDANARVMKKYAGEKWRPSNGTEGELFKERACYRCKHFTGDLDSCEIELRVMALDVDDPAYPEEWQINDEGQPVCTAFEEEA